MRRLAENKCNTKIEGQRQKCEKQNKKENKQKQTSTLKSHPFRDTRSTNAQLQIRTYFATVFSANSLN